MSEVKPGYYDALKNLMESYGSLDKFRELFKEHFGESPTREQENTYRSQLDELAEDEEFSDYAEDDDYDEDDDF
jgi:hypothetical protein